jgi:hypothetical protein
VPLPEGETARSTIVLEVARVAAATFLIGGGGLTRREIADALTMPAEWVGYALQALCDTGLFAATASDGDEGAARYFPARPLDNIAVLDVMRAERKSPEETPPLPPASSQVNEFRGRLEAAERSALGGLSLAALAKSEKPQP